MTENQEEGSDELKFNTTPNQLTALRIVFVPVVVAMLYMRTPGWDLAAAIAFGVASITDYFDGYIARQQKSVSVYGRLMDPLADKFLVVSAIVMLLELGRVHAIVVMLLICRELGITALRSLASAEGVEFATSRSAKWKTATQMVAIPFMMVKPGILGIPLFNIGVVLLYLSLAISLGSAGGYIVDFIRELPKRRAERRAAKLARKNKLKEE